MGTCHPCQSEVVPTSLPSHLIAPEYGTIVLEGFECQRPDAVYGIDTRAAYDGNTDPDCVFKD